MPSIIQNGKSQFLNGTGVPLAGGSVTFYVPGTTTFKTTYQDSGLTIPNSNPITLDANGEAQIWGGGLYRQVVKDSLGNQIWDTVASAGLIASDLINYTYALDTGTANTYVVVRANPTATLADGDVVRFQAKNNNTGTSTLQVDSFSALPLWVNGANLPSGVIVAGADYECIYNLALNVWLLIGQSGGLIVGPGAQLTAGLTGTTATFSGAVSAASAAISGNETVGGTLAVTGTISGAAATTNGQAAIMGATNTGAITFTGTASVAPATASGHAVNLGQLLIGSRKAVFTANGTYTVPPSVTQIWVSGCAGGGGGAGGGGTVGSTGNVGGGGAGGGGAGQSTIKQAISVTAGHSLSITIGAAGAGGGGGANTGASGGNGTSGGNTVLTDSTSATTLLTLTGGSGGSAGAGQTSTSAGNPAGGSGGAGGTGYANGSFGGDGNYAGNGGAGASCAFGSGGGSGRGAQGTGVAGAPASGYGAGGGGGGGSYGGAAAAGGGGAAGAPGFFVIEW